MDKIIAADPGKFDIKAAYMDGGKPTLIDYRAKLYTLREDEHFESQGNSKFITYEGKQYIIGDQGQDPDMSLAKSTILHKVGVMAALSDVIEEGDTVKLVLGCPAAIYKNKDTRKEYKNYITDGGLLSFETDTKHFDITISSTLVLPETGGIPFIFPELFRDARVAVIDLGGLNLNFAVFDNGIIDLSSMNTENHGGYWIENAIKTRFGGRYSCMLRQADILKIINLGGIEINGKVDESSKALLEEIYKEFIEEIPNIVKGFNYDLSLMGVVFIGGTSQLLGSRLMQTIPQAVIGKDLKWANVLGFLRVAQEKYKSK